MSRLSAQGPGSDDIEWVVEKGDREPKAESDDPLGRPGTDSAAQF
jgi:hypothetical protein